MQKLWAIAWKDIYQTFTDRSLLVVMILTPLVLATIISMAFGGLSGGQLEIGDIPVVLVNLDEGIETNGQQQNFGETFVNILVPAEVDSATNNAVQCGTDEAAESDGGGLSLDELFISTVLDDEAAARAGVEDGTYDVAIIIPNGFTAALTPQTDPEAGASFGDPAPIVVFANAGATLSGNIAQSVTTSITQQFITGGVTIAATIDQLVARAQADLIFGAQFLAASVSGEFQPDFACAFTSDLGVIDVIQQPLTAVQQQSQFVQILIETGAAQAVFFALFTANFGLLSIYAERDAGTLQRLLVSPTNRITIISGKVVGAFAAVILQIVLLLLSLTLIASLVEGQAMFIWGNPLLVFVVLVAISVAVAGVGIFIAGIARTAEQSRVIGPIVFAGLAALGGAFGFSLPQTVSQFSLIYWGVDAFEKLSGGSADIGLNLIVLLVQGVILFGIGAWLFNRRTQI